MLVRGVKWVRYHSTHILYHGPVTWATPGLSSEAYVVEFTGIVRKGPHLPLMLPIHQLLVPARLKSEGQSSVLDVM